MRRPLQHARINAALIFVALSFLAYPQDAAAQSSDPGYPAPVFSSEISARISPRDLGDARRTRHFYTFRGTEGDVLITLEGSELVGDLDVFTATTQRPLLKITLLGDVARITKSFYVRKEETLILRVEARAVADAEGTYRITFGGSFAPAPTDLASAPPPEPTASSAESRGKGTRRVTSTGARIEEPVVVAARPDDKAKEKDSAPTENTDAGKTAARREAASSRRARGARTNSSRTRASKPKPVTDAEKPETAETKASDDAGSTTEAKPDAGNKAAAETKTDAETPAASPASKPTPRRKGARPAKRNARGESAATGEASAAQPAAPEAQPAATPSQRLVIVTKDGETLERDMTTVRRVTIENNQLVVVSKDGRVSRQPMANVLRMSIEP